MKSAHRRADVGTKTLAACQYVKSHRWLKAADLHQHGARSGANLLFASVGGIGSGEATATADPPITLNRFGDYVFEKSDISLHRSPAKGVASRDRRLRRDRDREAAGIGSFLARSIVEIVDRERADLHAPESRAGVVTSQAGWVSLAVRPRCCKGTVTFVVTIFVSEELQAPGTRSFFGHRRLGVGQATDWQII